jgi:hypothetical protein
MNPRDELRRIVAYAKGDDLERANFAFASFSEEELDQEHGQSGETRRAVWDSYKRAREEWQAASDLLDRLLEEVSDGAGQD